MNSDNLDEPVCQGIWRCVVQRLIECMINDLYTKLAFLYYPWLHLYGAWGAPHGCRTLPGLSDCSSGHFSAY